MKRSAILAVALAQAVISASGQNAESQKSCASPCKTEAESGLAELRLQIDSLDSEIIDLLAKRMQVCLAVGKYKKEHGIAVVQSNRYNEIVEKRGKQGTAKGLGEEFVRQLVELIHGESVRQQQEITGK